MLVRAGKERVVESGWRWSLALLRVLFFFVLFGYTCAYLRSRLRRVGCTCTADEVGPVVSVRDLRCWTWIVESRLVKFAAFERMSLGLIRFDQRLRYGWGTRVVCGRKRQCVEIESETVSTFRLVERKTARFKVVSFRLTSSTASWGGKVLIMNPVVSGQADLRGTSRRYGFLSPSLLCLTK